MTLPRDF